MEGPPVNGPVRQANLAWQSPPFRCDSLNAQDCFEMFQRHQSGMAMTTVAAQPVLNRFAPSANEPTDCTLNEGHRGDRCFMRGNR